MNYLIGGTKLVTPPHTTLPELQPCHAMHWGLSLATRLFQLLPFFGCDHEFSWPHRWADGAHYQVCIRCGAEYLYDWSSMRRIRRIRLCGVTAPTCQPRHSWRPRARRLRVDLAMHFRTCGMNNWTHGKVRNLSQTGLLVETDAPLLLYRLKWN